MLGSQLPMFVSQRLPIAQFNMRACWPREDLRFCNLAANLATDRSPIQPLQKPLVM